VIPSQIDPPFPESFDGLITMFARAFASSRVAAAAIKSRSGARVAALASGVSASALAFGLLAQPEPALCKAAPSKVDWYKLREDLMALMESETASNPSVDGASNGGGGAIAPMMVRLAWHCAGTYDAKTGSGGSDGATMRFKPESEHGANAGLHHARALLEPIKRAHPGVTYADLYVYAGVLAVEACGGPNVGFRPGRSDSAKPMPPTEDKRFTPDGRLPDADAGDHGHELTAQHIRNIFYRMGFDDHEIVALSGAHALGRCHTDRSGYWCAPTRARAAVPARARRDPLTRTCSCALRSLLPAASGARGRAPRRCCRTSTTARCSRTSGPSRRSTRASPGTGRCSTRTRAAS
jgi:hypothetical protein